MTNAIIVGHGGYGTAVGRNLSMMLGDTPGMLYVDFNEDDDLNSLNQKLRGAIAQCGENEILICCDFSGGSPFRQACMLALENPKLLVVSGLSACAYAEFPFSLAEMSAAQARDAAVETTKNSILCYPPKAE